jgi:hypothetical protein
LSQPRRSAAPAGRALTGCCAAWGHLIHEDDSEALLGECTDLDAALLAAELSADASAAVVEEQLRVNGEGHPGGVVVALAVHESGTGRRVGEVSVCTAPNPAAV